MSSDPKSTDQKSNAPQNAGPMDAPSAQPDRDDACTIGATGDAQDSALEKDPSEWVSGDDPMTESQRSYLDTLAKQAGEELPANLTKAQASEHIDRLRGQQG